MIPKKKDRFPKRRTEQRQGLRNRIKILCLGVLLSLFLTACIGPKDAVATVDKVPISLQEFETADQIAQAVLPKESYSDPDEERKAARNRQKEVLQMLVWEAIVREDASNSGLDVEKPYQDLWKKTMDDFGDLKSLEVQLQSLGVSEASFKSSLRREAMLDAHRKKIAKDMAPGKEDLEKYYQKNKDKCALISYIQVSLPTHAEAQELAKSWKKDPSVIPDSEAKYNGDLFENTRYDQFSNVGIHDPRLVDPDIFKQEKGEVNWTYSNGLYYVITVTERLSAFSDVESQVRTLYEEENYLNYMKKLAGKYHVHLYENNLPAMDKNAEETSASDAEESA